MGACCLRPGEEIYSFNIRIFENPNIKLAHKFKHPNIRTHICPNDGRHRGLPLELCALCFLFCSVCFVVCRFVYDPLNANSSPASLYFATGAGTHTAHVHKYMNRYTGRHNIIKYIYIRSPRSLYKNVNIQPCTHTQHPLVARNRLYLNRSTVSLLTGYECTFVIAHPPPCI